MLTSQHLCQYQQRVVTKAGMHVAGHLHQLCHCGLFHAISQRLLRNIHQPVPDKRTGLWLFHYLSLRFFSLIHKVTTLLANPVWWCWEAVQDWLPRWSRGFAAWTTIPCGIVSCLAWLLFSSSFYWNRTILNIYLQWLFRWEALPWTFSQLSS